MTLTALGLWGWLQLALDGTVYRHATLERTLDLCALSALALAACAALDQVAARRRLIEALAWIGSAVAVVGVLAYYNSPGKILWLWPAAYPDTWGPFLSRNNFAQFLELCLPPALWLAVVQPQAWRYAGMAAAMLAAGLISASRAGAALLVGEAVLILWWTGRLRTRWAAVFGLAAAALAVAGGAETLWGRLRFSPVLGERGELYRSSLRMIAQRPLQGYGLGTYRWVYPEFARFDSGYAIEHAHNDWLEFAAEGGVGFALLWAVLAARLLRVLREQLWGLGTVALFLHALVDFPLTRPGVSAWAFILIGAIERTRAQPPLLRRSTTT
jgi:O-antigen ligase